jgi:uncharacterized membrane protein
VANTTDVEKDGLGLGPCASYQSAHPRVRNVIAEHEERLSLGQRVADRLAVSVGSWPFIIVQSCLLAVWMGLNVYLVIMTMRQPGFLKAWDPYPFILLNLVLSFQAAYTGPVVMMSQNRQAEKDRLLAQHDYEINRRAEEEVEVVMDHLEHQDRLILAAIGRLEALQATPPVEAVAQKVEEILKRLEQNDQRIMTIIARLEQATGRATA